MGMGSYGRGGGMPSYQQGPSFGGKGGSRPMGQPSPYGASPYGGGMGGSRQMPMMGQFDFGKLGSALGGAFVPGGQVPLRSSRHAFRNFDLPSKALTHTKTSYKSNSAWMRNGWRKCRRVSRQ
jgi:hypothetical protein